MGAEGLKRDLTLMDLSLIPDLELSQSSGNWKGFLGVSSLNSPKDADSTTCQPFSV